MWHSVKSFKFILLLSAFCFNIVNSQLNGLDSIVEKNRREEQRTIRDAKAAEVLKFMNLEVDPCADFYEFACGNWSYFNPPSEETPLVAVHGLIEARISKDLQLLLEESSEQEAASIRKVKDFYKSCRHERNKSQIQYAFLTNFVKSFGGLPAVAGTNWHPNYDWVEKIASLRAHYGLEILMGLDIDKNLHTNRGYSIYLSEPKTTLLPAEYCSATVTRKLDMRDEAYEAIQQEVAQNMHMWFSLNRGEAERFAGDIIHFEFELCKKMREEQMSMRAQEESAEIDDTDMGNSQHRRAPHRTGQNRLRHNRNSPYPSYDLLQLNRLFGDIINFKKFVDISFNTTINSPVYIRSEEYFRHLARTVRTNTSPTIANYIMYRALSVINFPNVERPKYCVDLVLRYFPKIVGELYNRKFDRSEVRTDIEMLYAQIKSAFEESLDKTEWMDENTKRMARQKLSPLKVQFPLYQNLDLNDLPLERINNYWRKLELIMRYNAKREFNRLYQDDSDESDSIEAPEVRVKLVSTVNKIYLGLGLLQPPFYNYYYPNTLKFALVGQRLARELITAFDEQGWQPHPSSQMHLSEYATDGFRTQSECFRTQLSNYLHNSPDVFQNASKLREVIVDSSGLNVAFNAYLAWLNVMEPSDRLALLKETLPEVNFTNTQLFFIYFAQMRCGAKYGEQELPNFLPMAKHTPERYDVNGILSNFVEFGREFNCAMGADMNPDDKCVVY